MMIARFARVAAGFCVVALGSVLGACAGSDISGRVITGPAALVTLVEESDTRLTSPGVPGLEVEVQSVDRGGQMHKVGTATTDADGSFTVPVPDTARKLTHNPMFLMVKRAGILAVKESVMLPGEGRKVLVLIPQGTKGSK